MLEEFNLEVQPGEFLVLLGASGSGKTTALRILSGLEVPSAGHVYIGAHAIVGGMTAVQQFVKIGDHAFIGGGTLVRKDVPPYIRVAREPLSYVGVNKIGLKRRGFDSDTIKRIHEIYRILFVKHQNLSIGLRQLEKEIQDDPLKDEVLQFIANSEKGIIRGFRKMRSDEY